MCRGGKVFAVCSCGQDITCQDEVECKDCAAVTYTLMSYASMFGEDV